MLTGNSHMPLVIVKVCCCCLVAIPDSFMFPCTVAHQDFPGKNTGMGCLILPQKSSQHRDRTHVSYVSYIDRRILLPLSHLENLNC